MQINVLDLVSRNERTILIFMIFYLLFTRPLSDKLDQPKRRIKLNGDDLSDQHSSIGLLKNNYSSSGLYMVPAFSKYAFLPELYSW